MYVGGLMRTVNKRSGNVARKAELYLESPRACARVRFGFFPRSGVRAPFIGALGGAGPRTGAEVGPGGLRRSLSRTGAGVARSGSRSDAIETMIGTTVVFPPLGFLSHRLEPSQLLVELCAVGGPAAVELGAREGMKREVEFVSCLEALARNLLPHDQRLFGERRVRHGRGARKVVVSAVVHLGILGLEVQHL
eukprot:scaffold84269_cov64-Phaeocystis_antarctica.AAC.3